MIVINRASVNEAGSVARLRLAKKLFLLMMEFMRIP